MGKREQARQEAAFHRGEVGIDGASESAAAENQVDVAEQERGKAREQLLRGRTYLGRELLTWLLWRSESGDPIIEWRELSLVVQFQGRLSLKGIQGEVTELSVKGALAPYSDQIRFALQRGLLVHVARLRFEHGERLFEATLDAEFLDVRAAKLPELMTEEEDDRSQERLQLAQELSLMVEALTEKFLEVRQSRVWRTELVPAMRRWMEGEGQGSVPETGAAPSRLAAKAARLEKPV
jgi:hypothetical protein